MGRGRWEYEDFEKKKLDRIVRFGKGVEVGRFECLPVIGHNGWGQKWKASLM